MCRVYRFFCLVIIFLCGGALVPHARAQKNSKPLEISADDTLEWHRNDQFFLARKNVKVLQGDTELKADLLTAKYKETHKSNIDIHTIIAEGHVRMHSGNNTVSGDKAIYDLIKGYAVVTGKDLRFTSPDQVVTARDRLEYWDASGKVQAVGNARVLRGEDKLEAQSVSAVFIRDTKGQRVLKTLEAHEDVVITTPSEVLKGDRALYTAQTNAAEIIGHVVITRGLNILQGERATVDLNTNVSKIFGGPAQDGQPGSGRVHGVFYPGSDKGLDTTTIR